MNMWQTNFFRVLYSCVFQGVCLFVIIRIAIKKQIRVYQNFNYSFLRLYFFCCIIRWRIFTYIWYSHALLYLNLIKHYLNTLTNSFWKSCYLCDLNVAPVAIANEYSVMLLLSVWSISFWRQYFFSL